MIQKNKSQVAGIITKSKKKKSKVNSDLPQKKRRQILIEVRFWGRHRYYQLLQSILIATPCIRRSWDATKGDDINNSDSTSLWNFQAHNPKTFLTCRGKQPPQKKKVASRCQGGCDSSWTSQSLNCGCFDVKKHVNKYFGAVTMEIIVIRHNKNLETIRLNYLPCMLLGNRILHAVPVNK